MTEETKKIYEIIEKGLIGNGLEEDEIAALLKIHPFSAESYHLRWAAYTLAQEASDGIAEVHAQVGMDASACPKNCQFCSFAACNGLRPPSLEMPKEEVIEYVKAYEQAGANLICLMVTAAYDFNKFLDIGNEVKNVISKDMPLMANIDDFTYEQALQLKQAGFNCIYHVIHMGEGEITNISPETRLATIENAKKAGLKLSSCVEPIGREHSPEIIAKRMKQLLKLEPLSTGAGWRIPVPKSPFANERPRLVTEWQTLNSVYRLAAGKEVRLLGSAGLTADSGGNYGWAEVGTNPRDTSTKTEDRKSGVSFGVAETQKAFAAAGWKILQGPSQGWI